MFRQIYSFDGANEASKRTKINNVRKLFRTLTIRLLKNLAVTVTEECFYIQLIVVISRDG